MLRVSLGGLRFRLFLLVLLVILPATGAVLYAGYQQSQDARSDALRTAGLMAQLAADQLSLMVEGTQKLLISLGQSNAVRDRSHPEICNERLAGIVAQFPEYLALGVADLQGDVFCSAPKPHGPVNVRDHLYYQKALQSRGFSAGDFQTDRITGKATLIFSYPVFDENGQAMGAIFAAFNLNWVNQLAAKALQLKGSDITVFDHHGTILAHYPDPGLWVGKTLSKTPVVQEILAHDGRATAEAPGLDGILRLYAYTSVDGNMSNSLVSSVGIPTEIAYAEVRQIETTLLTMLSIVMVLTLAAAWIGADVFILRRAKSLLNAILRLKAGDLSARTGLPHGSGEIGKVVRAFDEMAESLQAQKTKVEQAGNELRKVNRSLRILIECNRVLVRTSDEAELLDEICQTIVQFGDYRLAWVGFAEKDEAKTIRPAAYAGLEAGYLKSVDITWAEEDACQRPAGVAIRSGETVVEKEIGAHPNFAPWRAEAVKRGYASVISLPLLENKQAFGVLGISAEEPGAFDEEEVRLLENLAADVAYGILALRMRIQHEQAEAKIHRQLQTLATLRTIDTAISSSLDLRFIFDIMLDKVTLNSHLDAACLFLLNPQTQKLDYAAGKGFRSQDCEQQPVRLGEGYAGIAALERRMIYIPDLRAGQADPMRTPLFLREGFVSYFALPLIAKGDLKGVLEVFHRSPLDPGQELRDFLEALAGQAAIALDNARLFNDLQQSNVELALAYDTTIEGWSRAMDLRDKETEGHSRRVMEMSVKLGRRMGLSEAELVHARRGALLHDIGKIGVPDTILLKAGALSAEEWEIMRRHPLQAYELLAPIPYLRPALDIPYYHHEKWDGSGYPRGLKGEQIPLAARIFAIVDVWDALLSDRPYRPAWPIERVKEYILEQSGKHFDPEVVTVFMGMVSSAAGLA